MTCQSLAALVLIGMVAACATPGAQDRLAWAEAEIDRHAPPLPTAWEWRTFPFEAGELRWGIAEAENAKGTILFMPGFTTFIEYYAGALTRWHENGYTVIGLDLPGQGGSDGRADHPDRPWSGDMEDYSRIVSTFAAAALPDQPRPLIASGHSFGGHIAFLAQADGTLDADALILHMPSFRVRSRIVPEGPTLAILGVQERIGLGGALVPGGQIYRIDRDMLSGDNPCTYNDQRSALQRAYYITNPAFRVSAPTAEWVAGMDRSGKRLAEEADLSHVDIPVLALIAENDRVIFNDRTIEICGDQLPQCRLVRFKDTGHCFYTEPEATRLAADRQILQFADIVASTFSP
ncbi:lysophospholipase [Parvularcula bermudensis HTCC2503]|uniref:Lysophospholipase n=1 Tax=Parvularcula bermudensis (strain ATCC BAA-594 / HTCC2503 / KCTC 12087) TaxID=314260 RepID=E0TI38_PARBH|nr:alpha/beta hydrolase [Parvularcula bermudensis]ADM09377.1 lysophospholipase [Parvularcula bermudensis HTCC2503]